MSSQTLQLLNIDETLRIELAQMLLKFDGLRVGNDLTAKTEKVVNSAKKDSKVSRLIKRLFLTEYDAA